MRATEVLQKCLGDALQPMHALRRRVMTQRFLHRSGR
jgi:hypothetical protein